MVYLKQVNSKKNLYTKW